MPNSGWQNCPALQSPGVGFWGSHGLPRSKMQPPGGTKQVAEQVPLVAQQSSLVAHASPELVQIPALTAPIVVTAAACTTGSAAVLTDVWANRCCEHVEHTVQAG